MGVDEKETLVTGGEKTTETNDWKSGLSEEYRSDQRLADYKSVDDLVKSHFNAQEMIGKKVKVPGGDASDEEWNKFNKEHWGVPESVGDYGIEATGIDSARLEAILNGAHKAGLNKRQAAAMANHLAELGQADAQAYAQSREDSYKRMVDKYGSEEKAKEVIDNVNNYAEKVFGKESELFNYLANTEIIKENGEKVILGNDLPMVEILMNMFEKTTDDSKRVETESQVDPADLMQEFRELNQKMSQYQGYREDAEYQGMQKRLVELQQKIGAVKQ